MFPEIVKLEIEEEIDGFQRTTLERLLNSFDSIEVEATNIRNAYLKSRSENFDPDRDDEACIEEDAYFKEVTYISIENELKKEFLNSTSTWLFHLFERQKKRVFGSDKTEKLKPILSKNGYMVESCTDWLTLNQELRLLANAVKHGPKSGAAKKLFRKYPSLVANQNITIKQADIERYILSLKNFWSKALEGRVVL